MTVAVIAIVIAAMTPNAPPAAVNNNMPQTPTTQQLWDELGQTLRAYFAQRLADSHAVDDLTQEVFLRIHRGLDSLTDADRIGPWVFRIARNVFADHLRRRKPQAELDESQLTADSQNDQVLEKRIGRCLRSMLDYLPDDYRRAIQAVEIDEQTQAAYAKSAGLSISGAKSRVQRGRQKLKEELLACCQFEFDRLGKPVTMNVGKPCKNKCGCE